MQANSTSLDEKLARLDGILLGSGSVLVAYSGGVDSAFLLVAASRALGDRMLGVIADSPSLPRAALADALALAADFGVLVEVAKTQELEDPRYAANPPDRCYFCKAELFSRMEALAEDRGFDTLAYGENADDPAHLRPGSRAAREFAVVAPLRAAGLTKADVREASRRIGLPTADAPAQPCLSSRIPHGMRVTPDRLALVERGEAWVRSLGFRIFRVRLRDGEPPAAQVAIAPSEFGRLDECRNQIVGGLLAAGFSRIEFDPDGYR